MKPTIVNNSGVFEILGSIITENSSGIKNHFEKLLENKEEVIISIDNVRSIDFTGINVLATLYKKAVKENKALYIIGKSNENIKKMFAITKMDFILSRDFV